MVYQTNDVQEWKLLNWKLKLFRKLKKKKKNSENSKNLKKKKKKKKLKN